MIDKEKIRQIYSRLIGIELYLQKAYPHNVRREVADNYSKLIAMLEGLVEDRLEDFQIPANAYFFSTNAYCYMDLFLPKLTEFRYFLEASFPFVRHNNLPWEIKGYLSIRQGIINFFKKQIEKRI